MSEWICTESITQELFYGVVLWHWVVSAFFPFFFLFLPPPAVYSQPKIRTARDFLVEKAPTEFPLLCVCANAKGTGIEQGLGHTPGAVLTRAAAHKGCVLKAEHMETCQA